MRLSRWLLLNTGLLLFDTQWFTLEIVKWQRANCYPKGNQEEDERGQRNKPAKQSERSEHVDSVNGIAIHLTVLYLVLKNKP